jgi:predicted metal-dependent enzyme (double-stranded beta helix superfamily)
MRWSSLRVILFLEETSPGRRTTVSMSLAAPELGELGSLTKLAPELALRRAVPLLGRLVKDRIFLDEHILPILKEDEEVDDWYLAHRCEGKDGYFSLETFVWPAGTRTQIHDHTSWGAYCCVAGSVLEERYERLDNGSQLDHARLKKLWQLSWSPEDGPSTVLPGDGGIHRVGNPGDETAISVHLYGPRIGEVDGHDYAPSRDYVCGRVVA